jgi:hypothetical protein
VPTRKYCEATAAGTVGVVVQVIALLSQESSVIAFCDDAKGGSLDEILQNAFLKGVPMEPPPLTISTAVSIVLPS